MTLREDINMIQRLKGTYDVLPGEIEKWQYVGQRNHLCSWMNWLMASTSKSFSSGDWVAMRK